MKISIIGCSKRFKNSYFYILNALGHDISVWNRTLQKSIDFCNEKKIDILDNISDANDADLILCFTPPETHFEIISKLKTKATILVETPAIDSRLISCESKVGVMEQWPHLPLEQMKELIFSSGVMKRPYIVMNDGRSFDYHAMAQLRAYIDRSVPKWAVALSKNHPNHGVKDFDGTLNSKNHDWLLGHIEMSNGSILSYNFTYNCKSLLSIPIQFLRCLSEDGSITTGRMKEMGNDYEVIDVRTVNSSKEVEIQDVTLSREAKVTKSISVAGVKWENQFQDLMFDDQQVAMATLVTNAMRGDVYSYKDSYIDYVCINMIKQAAHSRTPVRIN